MGIEILIGIVALILTVVIPVALHRREHPTRQVRWRVQAVRLLSADLGASRRISVTVDGRSVRDPHLVTVTLWSSGRADVPSSSFDQQLPITVRLGVPILEQIDATPEAPNPWLLQPDVLAGTSLTLPPMLLRRGSRYTTQALVEGRPTPYLEQALIDIPVVEEKDNDASEVVTTRTKRRQRFRTADVILISTLSLGMILLTIGVSFYTGEKGAGMEYSVPGLLLVMFAIAYGLVLYTSRAIRFFINRRR